MNTKQRKYLYDIHNCILEIEEFLGKKRNFIAYQKNKLLKSAVERQLIIIGEAMNRLLAIDSQINISSAKTIIQFRNKITHEYDAIDDPTVWNVVVNHLPTLKTEVEILLES